MRLDGPCRLARRRVRVHPDVAKVGAQTRFHEALRVTVKWRTAARPDDLLYQRWLLLFKRCTDRGVAGRLLQVHHGSGGKGLRPPVHQGLGTSRRRRILSSCRRLVALGIDQEIVFVRLHAYASVELSCYRKAWDVLLIDLTPCWVTGQRSTAQVNGHPRLPNRPAEELRVRLKPFGRFLEKEGLAQLTATFRQWFDICTSARRGSVVHCTACGLVAPPRRHARVAQ